MEEAAQFPPFRFLPSPLSRSRASVMAANKVVGHHTRLASSSSSSSTEARLEKLITCPPSPGQIYIDDV